jgi:hypothetical protein
MALYSARSACMGSIEAEPRECPRDAETFWCLLAMAMVTTVLAKERRTPRLEEMMVDDYRWRAINPAHAAEFLDTADPSDFSYVSGPHTSECVLCYGDQAYCPTSMTLALYFSVGARGALRARTRHFARASLTRICTSI